VLVKIVTFFLIGIAVLAMFGKLRLPKGARRLGRRDEQDKLPPKPGKCRHCGAFKVGPGPCPCGKG